MAGGHQQLSQAAELHERPAPTCLQGSTMPAAEVGIAAGSALQHCIPDTPAVELGHPQPEGVAQSADGNAIVRFGQGDSSDISHPAVHVSSVDPGVVVAVSATQPVPEAHSRPPTSASHHAVAVPRKPPPPVTAKVCQGVCA